MALSRKWLRIVVHRENAVRRGWKTVSMMPLVTVE
jgi:hypothetical protein